MRYFENQALSSRSVHPFLHSTQTGTETTLRAMRIGKGRIYAKRAMRPNDMRFYYRRRTARRATSVEFVQTALQQCMNKLYRKSRASRSNGARGVTVDQRQINFVHPAAARSTVASAVNKHERRRVLSTTRSTSRGEIKFSKSSVWDHVAEGSRPTLILEITDFSDNTVYSVGGGKHPRPN